MTQTATYTDAAFLRLSDSEKVWATRFRAGAVAWCQAQSMANGKRSAHVLNVAGIDKINMSMLEVLEQNSIIGSCALGADWQWAAARPEGNAKLSDAARAFLRRVRNLGGVPVGFSYDDRRISPTLYRKGFLRMVTTSSGTTQWQVAW